MTDVVESATLLAGQRDAATAERRSPRSGLRYLRDRALQGIIVILGAIVISFVLANLSGNRADLLSGNAPPEQRAAVARELGLDRPIGERFVDYLGGVAQLDFGTSAITGTPAIREATTALPNTLLLVALAIAVAVSVSIPISVFSVLHPGHWFDRFARGLLMVLQGIPEFWLAILLTAVFSVQLGMLPSIDFTGVQSLILPVVALSVPLCPTMVRVLRGELLEVQEADFNTALRAKGLSDRYIVWRHGLRNAAPQFITLVALQIGWLIGGTLIVEVVFSWPGIGSLLQSAVSQRDLPVVESIVVVVAVAYVVLNLLADMLVIAIDPRIRSGAR